MDWLDDFADSGFLGQTNVGHLVQDAATAKKNYLVFWTLLKGKPERADARPARFRCRKTAAKKKKKKRP